MWLFTGCPGGCAWTWLFVCGGEKRSDRISVADMTKHLWRCLGSLALCMCACFVAQSCLTLCDPMDCSPSPSLLCPWDFPGKNTGVGCHFLFQGIFLTQGLNPRLLHWQVDYLPLCHQGSHSQGLWKHFPFLHSFRHRSGSYFLPSPLPSCLSISSYGVL